MKANNAAITSGFVNIAYDFDLDLPVRTLIMAGVGVAHIDPGDIGNDTVRAGQADAGTALPVTEHVEITLDYRYIITSEAEFSESGINGT